MAYGYYADPGTSFGNTGQTQNETFIQRQQRLQAPKPTQPTAPKTGGAPITPQGGAQQIPTFPATGGTGTPVAGNGSIPPPTPAAPAPAPAPAAPAAPAPQANGLPAGASYVDWADPNDPNALVKMPNGQLLPKSHPEYLAWAQGKTAAGATGAGAGGAATTGTPGSALGGAAEAAKSGMFTQAAPPEHDFQNWQQLELVSQLLANPHTMTPQVIDQMKQKSMEEALLFQQQNDAQNAQDLAARGFTAPGGLADAQRRKSADAINSAILGQNRDFEIQAASQNRQDELGALGVAESILGGQVGRGSQVYSDVLAGQQANRGDHWTGQQLALQKELGVGGLGIDQQRVNNQNRQFDASHGLNILQFLEGQRQADNSLGFNYSNLNANQQGATMDRIMRALGG